MDDPEQYVNEARAHLRDEYGIDVGEPTAIKTIEGNRKSDEFKAVRGEGGGTAAASYAPHTDTLRVYHVDDRDDEEIRESIEHELLHRYQAHTLSGYAEDTTSHEQAAFENTVRTLHENLEEYIETAGWVEGDSTLFGDMIQASIQEETADYETLEKAALFAIDEDAVAQLQELKERYETASDSSTIDVTYIEPDDVSASDLRSMLPSFEDDDIAPADREFYIEDKTGEKTEVMFTEELPDTLENVTVYEQKLEDDISTGHGVQEQANEYIQTAIEQNREAIDAMLRPIKQREAYVDQTPVETAGEAIAHLYSAHRLGEIEHAEDNTIDETSLDDRKALFDHYPDSETITSIFEQDLIQTYNDLATDTEDEAARMRQILTETQEQLFNDH